MEFEESQAANENKCKEPIIGDEVETNDNVAVEIPKTETAAVIEGETQPAPKKKRAKSGKPKKASTGKKKKKTAGEDSIELESYADAPPAGAQDTGPQPMGRAEVLVNEVKVEVLSKPSPAFNSDAGTANAKTGGQSLPAKNAPGEGSPINSGQATPQGAVSPAGALTPVSVATPLGTGNQRVESLNNTVLPLGAVKIRNVVGKVVNLTAEIIPNKVIVQGVIDEQLFFVGVDGIVHHLADEVHFSAFIDLPGVAPGMNAEVAAEIEEIITELAPDGLSVLKKIILEVFVKVTETVQVNLEPGQGPALFVKEVAGENTVQNLVESDVTLSVPALKIDEIVGAIRDLEIQIIPDKVIIQGTLHKQIFFVDNANLGRHQAEEVHFSLFVDIPGAEPGMEAQVDSEIEAIFFRLISPALLHQKAVLRFFVKVTSQVRLPVAAGAGPLFKAEEFIGENTVQELSETIATLPIPAVKVREIVARLERQSTHLIENKVIVQGVIHKQIFFIGTDNIEHHQAEDVPFAVFLDIPGVSPGDRAHLDSEIEAVFFELVSDNQLRQKVIFQITATATREIQLNLAIGTGPLVKIDEVIAENTKQVLVVRREVIPPIPPLVPVVSRVTVITPGGEVFGRQQIILQNSVQLPVAAIKVKEIQAAVQDVTFNVITGGVVVEGAISKTVSFVGTDDIVRSITESVPFSILVSIPGITPTAGIEVTVNLENISFSLSPDGRTVNQIIVLEAAVSGETAPPGQFSVVTDVSGPGIVQTKVLVQGLVLTPAGAVFQQFEVVTDVSGPGIIGVTKQTVLLQAVGTPAPSPITVVTDVQIAAVA
ncbi:MAG: DUF3794 domain-containing protein [Firmicutes bacterium]|nr:DUF3794 domain-containing protein [Bacillota bacterium]